MSWHIMRQILTGKNVSKPMPSQVSALYLAEMHHYSSQMTELDVLRLLARGASNQDITEVLVVALNTVKHQVSMILSKLEASNRTQAVAKARSLGLLPDES